METTKPVIVNIGHGFNARDLVKLNNELVLVGKAVKGLSHFTLALGNSAIAMDNLSATLNTLELNAKYNKYNWFRQFEKRLRK